MSCPKLWLRLLIVGVSISVTSMSLLADQENPNNSHSSYPRESFSIREQKEPDALELDENSKPLTTNSSESNAQMSVKLYHIKAIGMTYTIQISAFFTDSEAKKEKDRLLALKTSDITIVVVNVGGKTVYRICTGIFKTRSEAMKSIKKVAHETGIKNVFVQKMIPKMTASN